MCGISGYYGKKIINLKTVNSTIELMKNRGPNFSNYYQNNFENGLSIYLLHTRLSIIDLSKKSNQPFIDDNYILIFNGEIYNFIELRKSLEKKGIFPKTKSDTEILLIYYKIYGSKCVDYFDGMWSFIVFNIKTQKLFASRDIFGEKPLYILKTGDGFYFGSEIKFIRELSQKNFTINTKKINRFLSYGYRSLFKDNECFYKNIFSLGPAENLFIDGKLNFKKEKYWVPKVKPFKNLNIKSFIEETKEKLINSLRIRMRSDVPVAFLLSGGIDSCGLASIATKILNKRINTFSIADNDSRYDETKDIQKICRDLNCENKIFKISKKNFIQNLTQIINYHDSPVWTLSNYLHNMLMESISSTNTKVVFSGIGGDEMFGGYYDHYLLHLHSINNKKFFKESMTYWEDKIKPLIRNKNFLNHSFFSSNKIDGRYTHDGYEDTSVYLNNPEKNIFHENDYSNNKFSNRRINETFHETLPVMLNNEDLNSMNYSIENRSPYLSKEIFNQCFSSPQENHIKFGYSKYILRECLNGILIDELRLNRQKKGFNCSIHSLIDTKEKRNLDFLLNKKSNIFEFVDRKKIKELFERKPKENHFSKFIFNFISTKIFLDKTL